ncbi:MAG: WecB/TagA/CpsF family glycosyltransferase [Elusimicrobia bacterium]|nr:WecB/TagA/CpsF family glycosyltransferase [Elusimicrobiota bacterium]
MRSSPVSVRVPIAGISVDTLTEKEVIERVKVYVESDEVHQIITANPLMIMAAEKDPALLAAFRSADLVVPDSVGVIGAALLKGRRLTKISGIDLLETLCAQAAERGWRVFFLGAAPGVAESAAKVLANRHTGLSVSGVHHGYFNRKNEETVIQQIAKSKSDLLFVALSTPFQDGWIHTNLNGLGAKVVMGVGGSFDVLSGRLHRAPRWMRAAGFEWLFRLFQEPRRAGRMLRLFIFVFKITRNSARWDR